MVELFGQSWITHQPDLIPFPWCSYSYKHHYTHIMLAYTHTHDYQIFPFTSIQLHIQFQYAMLRNRQYNMHHTQPCSQAFPNAILQMRMVGRPGNVATPHTLFTPAEQISCFIITLLEVRKLSNCCAVGQLNDLYTYIERTTWFIHLHSGHRFLFSLKKNY